MAEHRRKVRVWRYSPWALIFVVILAAAIADFTWAIPHLHRLHP